MKKLGVLSLLVISVLLFGSCGGNVPDNVLVSDIAGEVDKAIGNEGDLREVDSSYIKNTMKMEESEYSEFTVKLNAIGANIDEYGIFKGSDKSQTDAIAKSVEAYLKLRNDTWMTAYMPEERPKMQDASFKTVGNYVMYAILGSDEKKAAFAAFEDALK